MYFVRKWKMFFSKSYFRERFDVVVEDIKIK